MTDRSTGQTTDIQTTGLEMQSKTDISLRQKTAIAVGNFYRLPLSEGTHIHSEAEITEVADRVWEIIDRNNIVSEILSSVRFQQVKERKRKLRGDAEIGASWCVDGRLDGMSMGVLVDIWEVPAGLIANEEVSYGLIPSSAELSGHLKDDATSGRELLEMAFAHYDSTNPDHGCAANAAILATIKKNRSPENQGKLTFDDYSEINHTKKAEDANLIILRKTTVPAITDYYNRERTLAGLSPLKRVAIAALYDTATMGVTLRHQEEKDLAATDLTNKYKDTIGQNVETQFGAFKENFTEATMLLDFSERKVEIMELLLTSQAGQGFYQEVESYIQKVYSDLTEGQAQSLRFLMAESVAFQYLTGLSVIEGTEPNHPFAKHSEGYMGLSIRGEYIGKYDTKQAFGSTAADAADAIEQIKIEYGVMDKVGVDLDRPRIVFISNSISDMAFNGDRKAKKRAISNNNGISRQILKDPTIRDWVTKNRLCITNVLIDDTTGKVLDVLDHSSSF